MGESRRIRASILRGGTSKGVFLFEEDLPQDSVARDSLILRVFGSPDPRQINGLGGADPLTSKVAIIGRSQRPDADVDYTVGYVGIADAVVDYQGNCGNISVAVGPFAVDEGLASSTPTPKRSSRPKFPSGTDALSTKETSRWTAFPDRAPASS